MWLIYLGFILISIASILVFFHSAFKWSCVLFSVCALCILIFMLNFMNVGWDFNVFCSAIYAIKSGLNPYYPHNLQVFNPTSQLSFVYPVLSLIFISPFCNIIFTNTWILFYILLLILSIWIIYRTINNVGEIKGKIFGIDLIIVLSCIFLCVFNGVLWNFATGNIGILELFFISLCFLCFSIQRVKAGAFLLGFISAFKILSLIFVLPLYFFSDGKQHSFRNSLKFILYALVGCVVVHILSFLFHPSFYFSYLLQLFGKLSSGVHSPIMEIDAGWTNPTFLLYLKELLHIVSIHSIWISTFIISIIFFLIYLPLHKVLFYSNISSVIKFALSTLFLSLISLRFKPYTFTLIIPSFTILFLSINRFIIRSVIFLISISLCLSVFLFKLVNQDVSSKNLLSQDISLYTIISQAVFLSVSCIQSLSLLGVFIIISVYYYFTTTSSRIRYLTYLPIIFILPIYIFFSLFLLRA